MPLLIIALLGALVPSGAAAQGTLSPVGQQVFLDNSGNPISNGKICTYVAGTTTPQATYFDPDLEVGNVNANPIRTNSAGRPTTGGIYLLPTSYKFVVLTAGSDDTCNTGTTIWTQDDVGAVPTTAVDLDVTGIAGEDLAAGTVVYLSDGSGSLTAGRWYLADADNAYASSTAGIVGMAPTAIDSGASGTIRLAGRMTGLSGLTAGATYYASATAGALTATAPTNARLVGNADSTTSLIVEGAPTYASVVMQQTQINAGTPYALTWPAADAVGALTSDGSGTLSFAPVGGKGTVEGRLTATTGTPVTTGDVSAATSLYFTPYTGNQIALYDGSAIWTVRTFEEITIDISACTASKPYDVFAYDNSGVVTIETLVWTNATTRATALTTQDGVYVKTGATTRRYLGTFYCNGTGGQTDDTFAKRYVWNYYNRVPRTMRVLEATNTWTYTTATFQQANASAANQLDFVIGVAEVELGVQILHHYSNDTGGSGTFSVTAIGLDSTTTPATGCLFSMATQITASQILPITAELRTYPAVGRHTAVWLEKSAASGTATFYGDNGATNLQSGITGGIQG